MFSLWTPERGFESLEPEALLEALQHTSSLTEHDFFSPHLICTGPGDSSVLSFCESLLPCTQSLQSCLTLWDPTDHSLPGYSVHGIFLARMLEWFAMPSSRGSSWPRGQTLFCISVGFFTCWAVGVEQSFRLCGRRQGWDVSREQHRNMCII